MFKRQPLPVIIRDTRTEYVSREVHEHRAPTDDSIKLLREMEQKAEAEVIKAVQVGDTTFECVVHQALDNMSNQMIWRAIFKLNGTKMTATVETDPRDISPGSDGMRKAFDKLAAEMAKTIATEVLHEAFVLAMRGRFAR